VTRPATVFLVGFMGVGKTTIGCALARLLVREFIDLDERIVADDGRPIPRILEESGEPFFRAIERRLLAGFDRDRAIVVACGGGTYAHAPSRRVIDAAGVAVWLQLPLEIALARCGAGEGRPLFRDPEQARALYAARLPAYRAAGLHVDVEGLTPDEAAERIAGRL
jgi:shikimate kinase